jgi:hypothetical protein
MRKIVDLFTGIFAGFETKQMHVLLCMSAVLVCGLVILLLIRFFKLGKQLQ